MVAHDHHAQRSISVLRGEGETKRNLTEPRTRSNGPELPGIPTVASKKMKIFSVTEDSSVGRPVVGDQDPVLHSSAELEEPQQAPPKRGERDPRVALGWVPAVCACGDAVGKPAPSPLVRAVVMVRKNRVSGGAEPGPHRAPPSSPWVKSRVFTSAVARGRRGYITQVTVVRGIQVPHTTERGAGTQRIR